MEIFSQFIDLFLHLDKHLFDIIQQYGAWTYAFLFIVVFCETGLVVTPFLPGDSLLFAAGALSVSRDGAIGLEPWALFFLLSFAAILGDAINYMAGYFLGPRVLKDNARIFKKEYLTRTQDFYSRYGSKTIVIARFVPIVRTFAPFLAGVGRMRYDRFASYNIVGAVLWVGICQGAGYLFGNIPIVKNNFSLVILVIILVSVSPALFEWLRVSRQRIKT